MTWFLRWFYICNAITLLPLYASLDNLSGAVTVTKAPRNQINFIWFGFVVFFYVSSFTVSSALHVLFFLSNKLSNVIFVRWCKHFTQKRLLNVSADKLLSSACVIELMKSWIRFGKFRSITLNWTSNNNVTARRVSIFFTSMECNRKWSEALFTVHQQKPLSQKKKKKYFCILGSRLWVFDFSSVHPQAIITSGAQFHGVRQWLSL